MLQNVTFAAGETKEFREESEFFRILATTGGTVDVVFIRDGSVIAEAAAIQPGYSEKFNRAFDTIRMTSPSVQTVQFVMRYGSEVSYDVPPGGTLIFPAAQGAYTQSAPAIATASTQILAAKSSRRYLMIQNNDPATTIYLNLAGAAAAAATGLKIGPGGFYENADWPPNAAIFAIAITTANPLITVIEG